MYRPAVVLTDLRIYILRAGTRQLLERRAFDHDSLAVMLLAAIQVFGTKARGGNDGMGLVSTYRTPGGVCYYIHWIFQLQFA
jgi:hypothetical protein